MRRHAVRRSPLQPYQPASYFTSQPNSPLNTPCQQCALSLQVGAVAAFLCSPLASAITGSVVYVDNGLNTMGLAPDSKTLLEREA